MRWLAFPQMALSLALAVLATLALVGINEAGYRQSHEALAEVADAQRARVVLNLMLQNILDAETGQRGYLLTGEPRYREPYDEAVKQVDGHLAALQILYAHRPEQLAQLNQLAKHVSRKLAEMDMSVRLRQSGNEDAWKFVITTDVGREEMDAIRNQVGDLIAISNDELTRGQLQIARSLRFARIGIGLVALAGLIA